jgi:hypothetical protein
MNLLTQQRLKEVFLYNQDTGFFTYKINRGRRKVGDVAGHKSDGYIWIGIDRERYSGHRLAWFYTYGEFPTDCLDHVNRDRSDNKLSNLREATKQENLQNRNIQRNNKSGITGVSWNKNKGKFQAQISVDGKNNHLGWFKDTISAFEAYKAASIQHHKFSVFKESL